MEFSSGTAFWSCITESDFILFLRSGVLKSMHDPSRVAHLSARGTHGRHGARRITRFFTLLRILLDYMSSPSLISSSCWQCVCERAAVAHFRSFVYLRVDLVGERGAGGVTCRATIFPGRVLDCFGRAQSGTFFFSGCDSSHSYIVRTDCCVPSSGSPMY